MKITFNKAKHAKTLVERSLDFRDAALVLSGVTVEFEDTRKDYGEQRVIAWYAGKARRGHWLHPS